MLFFSRVALTRGDLYFIALCVILCVKKARGVQGATETQCTKMKRNYSPKIARCGPSENLFEAIREVYPET